MRAMGWNSRGFARVGRRTQIKDYIRKERIDIVFLQETLKQNFSDLELSSLESGEKFFWHWKGSDSRSGGLLLGIKDSILEVGGVDQGDFFISAKLLHRASNFKFEFIGVYGPADHVRSAEFLSELEQKVSSCQIPVVIGGDFNLIRGARDKNNNNINWPRVGLFNDCIARLALREIARTGARFTWSNRQRNPVRSVLDRFLVSPEWELKFPLVSLRAETPIGSDHTPLILDTGEEALARSQRFFFETSWLQAPAFLNLVRSKWEMFANQMASCRGPVDFWSNQSSSLRQFLKGWGANKGKQDRVHKQTILNQIQELDSLADANGLDEDCWALRYFLEDQLIHLQIGRAHV